MHTEEHHGSAFATWIIVVLLLLLVLAQGASARREAVQAASRLRLRADEYALDETQALHLWRTRDERGRSP